jgi:ADP-heptose:LPS heptosyltransferase
MAEPQHPDFYSKTRSARKIIVVDLGFLGDSVHLIPALWEIKEHYPEAELDVLTTRVGAEVISLTAAVHEAIVFPLGPKSPPWWQHWGILRSLRSRSYDLLFNFSGADRTVFISFIIGAKWRVGHFGARRHFWSSLLIPVWVDRQSRSLPVFEQKRQVLAECGMVLHPPTFNIRPERDMVAWAEANLPSHFVHFSINASSHIKEWPLENWVGLASRLLHENAELSIVVTGSNQPREQEKIGQFLHHLNHPRAMTPGRDLSIHKLTATLQRSLVHVGADSGVLHLAFASGIPTVAIFRKYEGLVEWAPSGSQHFRAEMDCPCVQSGNFVCSEATGAECLKKVGVGCVLELLYKAISLA